MPPVQQFVAHTFKNVILMYINVSLFNIKLPFHNNAETNILH